MSNKNQGYLLPADIQEIYDAPLVMFCGLVPDHPAMRAALLGAVSELGYWGQYEKTQSPDTRARDVAVYMRQLILECFMIDCCAKMRECIGTTIAPLLKQNADDLLKALEELYNELGAAGVAPDLVYDGSDDDLNRDLIVCFMCRQFVDTIMDAELKRRQDNLEQTFWTVNFIRDISIIAAPFLGPLAPWVAFGAAVGTVIGTVASVLAELDDAVLTDAVAREKVACCMFVNLAGATPTFTAFQTSLDGCGFNPLQNAEYIRQILQPLVQDIDIYLTWLATADEIAPYVDQGLLTACPCVPDWTHTSVFADGNDGWIATQGAFVPGVGLRTTGGGWARCHYDFGGDYRFKSVFITYTIAGTGDEEDRAKTIELKLDTVQVRYTEELNAVTGSGLVYGFEFAITTADWIEIAVYGEPGLDEVTITQVTLAGFDTDPFA